MSQAVCAEMRRSHPTVKPHDLLDGIFGDLKEVQQPPLGLTRNLYCSMRSGTMNSTKSSKTTLGAIPVISHALPTRASASPSGYIDDCRKIWCLRPAFSSSASQVSLLYLASTYFLNSTNISPCMG